MEPPNKNNGLGDPVPDPIPFLGLKKNSEVGGPKLPSNGEVLSVLLFHLGTRRNITHGEIADTIYDKLATFYQKIKVPIIPRKSTILLKLTKLFKEFMILRSDSRFRSNPQLLREITMEETLDDLFDISPVEALLTDEPKNVIEFLRMQRCKGRPGTMSDFNIGRKVSNPMSVPDPGASAAGAIFAPKTSEGDESMQTGTSPEDDDEKDPSFIHTEKKEETKPPRRKKKKLEVITERVVKVMDRYKFHARGVVHLIVAILIALEKNPKDYNISASTIEKRRKDKRKFIYEAVKEHFNVTKAAVVHFDGKQMSSITGNEKEERLAVKVTCGETDQFLGAPKTDGTGIDIAACVYNNLDEWNIKNKIEACCFDTTSSNTGIENGAAVFLEQFLGRFLLFLPCRHHIFELILKLVFEFKIEISSGPKVKIFERFKKQWGSFDKTKYKPGTDDLEVRKKFKGSIEPLKQFIQERIDFEIKGGTIRKDYFEFLELSLLFLGGKLIHKVRKESAGVKPKERETFHVPGADHHARWMSKAIYSLKIYLFREQFELTAGQKKGLADFNVFVIRFYLKMWFQCPSALSASVLDLQFIKDMIDFIDEDKKLATAIITKFSGHLWYLSEEAVAMAFFSKDVPLNEKRKMVLKLRIGEEESSNSEASPEEEEEAFIFKHVLRPEMESKPQSKSFGNEFDADFSMMNIDSENESSEDFDSECTEEETSRNSDEIFELCERRVKVTPEEIIKSFKAKNISDFVTKKTSQFFRRFQIPTKFLSNDPQTWGSDKDWIDGRTVVKQLKVTNDTAERGVKLISDFLGMLSKDEIETQYLYQVVSESRKEFPSHNIKDLVPES